HQIYRISRLGPCMLLTQRLVRKRLSGEGTLWELTERISCSPSCLISHSMKTRKHVLRKRQGSHVPIFTSTCLVIFGISLSLTILCNVMSFMRVFRRVHKKSMPLLKAT